MDSETPQEVLEKKLREDLQIINDKPILSGLLIGKSVEESSIESRKEFVTECYEINKQMERFLGEVDAYKAITPESNRDRNLMEEIGEIEKAKEMYSELGDRAIKLYLMIIEDQK